MTAIRGNSAIKHRPSTKQVSLMRASGHGRMDERVSRGLCSSRMQMLTLLSVLSGCLSSPPVETATAPEANRFTKMVLATTFNEPMEMEVLRDGKVIVVERKGAIKLYDPKKDALRIVTTLPVFSGLEDGLLGIVKDPAFDQNRWIYLFYSPVHKSVQRVSRYVFDDNALALSDEKVLFDLDWICFHL